MKRKKSKYEPPIVYDLAHAVKDEINAWGPCQTGATPDTVCDAGASAQGGKCQSGSFAGDDCLYGEAAHPAKCQYGERAGKKCDYGDLAEDKCKPGGIPGIW